MFFQEKRHLHLDPAIQVSMRIIVGRDNWGGMERGDWKRFMYCEGEKGRGRKGRETVSGRVNCG